jgi:predicted DNA repair protein MutK
MPGGLIALLDDVAAMAKLAAASIDDVAGAAGKAGAKAAGVVIDDTAVTPNYVVGLSPERELPIIWKITLGSLKNKLVFLLPAALALSALAPWAITPLLMLGGSYLCFEATEKIWHALRHDNVDDEVLEITDPADLEKRQVSGAIRTDFILSAEIMAIALSQLPLIPLWEQAVVLALVAVAITFGVYGVVALIVKMDDIGLHLARRSNALARSIGGSLLWLMPRLLNILSLVGTAAMLWVGGGIVLHGMEEFHLTALPEIVHQNALDAGNLAGGVAEWLTQATASAILGLIVGGVIVAVMHFMPSRKAAATH